jgi:hypothetical protein
MAFCATCGREAQEADRFCARCGTALGDATDEAPIEQAGPERSLWTGAPSKVFNPIEGVSVDYELTTERLRISQGILTRTHDEVELTRVRDVIVEQSLSQRAIGVGNVRVVASDATTPEILLHDVAEPMQVKELIRNAVREQRRKLRVRNFEDI